METVKLDCILQKGRGKGKSVVTQINTEMKSHGFNLFPGTYNLYCKQPIYFKKEMATFTFFNKYYLFKAELDGIECFIMRWVKCPPHVFELLSEQRLSVFNSDIKKTLIFDHDFIFQANVLKKTTWRLLWYFRESWYYKFYFYSVVTGKFIDFEFKYLNGIKNSDI